MSNATYTSIVKHLLNHHANGLIDKANLYKGLRRARLMLEK